MDRTPSILGFSMASKSSRRWLVLLCYAILAILLLLVFSAMPQSPRFLLLIVLNATFSSIQLVIIYKLVQDTVFRPTQKDDYGPLTLGLFRNAFLRKGELDERQVAVRNAAYHKAYRAVAELLLMLICFTGLITSTKLMVGICVALLYVILTLPQAIILWTEPNVPEEASS